MDFISFMFIDIRNAKELFHARQQTQAPAELFGFLKGALGMKNVMKFS